MTDKTKHEKIEAARAEAFARVRLRHKRGKAAHPGMAKADIGKAARRLVRKRVKGKGSAVSKLRDEWPEIVGPQLSKLCRPVKMIGAREGRILKLSVVRAAASLVEHSMELVRQRASVAAGGDIYKVVIDDHLMGVKTAQGELALPPKPLSPEDLAKLEQSVAGIDDPSLKAAIVSLGKAVLVEEKRSVGE